MHAPPLVTHVNHMQLQGRTMCIDKEEKQRLAALGTMAGGIAHEINNALTPILLFSEDFKAKLCKTHPEYEDILDVIINYTLYARDIVDDISLYSRQVQREKEDYLALELLSQTLELVKASIPNQIELSTAFDSNLRGKMINVNKTGFIQVILNILTNACQATGEKGIINLRATLENPHRKYSAKTLELADTDHLKIVIKDRGHGIAAEHLNLIFDPFFTTKNEGEGTGLGLSVVYGLIKQWQGEVIADSDGKAGARFTIWIPLKNEAEHLPAPLKKDIV